MRRLVLLGSLAALVVTPAAAPSIVPQRGIAGVSLTMSKARVRAVLGQPRGIKHGANDFGPYTEFRYLDLRITFQGNRGVTNIFTTLLSERTARGVGVGSTEATLRANVSHLRCKTEFGHRHCFVGRFLSGHRVTDFALKNGRVRSVNIGFVLD